MEGYYRLIKPLKEDEEVAVGELFYLTGTIDSGYEMISGSTSWTFSFDDFDTHFEFVPNGAEERSKQMATILASLQDIGKSNTQLLLQSDQLLLPGPDSDSKEEEEVSTKLITVTNSLSATKVQGQLKQIKTSVAKTKLMIEKKQKQLQLLVKEQELIMEQKISALSKQIAVANEAISVITTYLGKDEEIVCIRKGKPAPKETVISLRQRILYMDEECMIAATKGGIDFQKIDEFDKWIQDPVHLQQVLPEEKGIVALKPRRTAKRYSDSLFADAEINKHNFALYILIRNGERLYRIYSSLELGDVLIPRKDEFDKFFYKREYDHSKKKHVRRVLRPGSLEYSKAMEAADSTQRYYFKVLMLFQGLLDRTKVFFPLPCERLNLCDISECEEYARVIYDSEDLLGDGKPSFNEWQDLINEKLEVGHRIIGSFDHYGIWENIKSRISPTNAYYPDKNTLYTIERKSGDDGFVFLYEREERIWTRYGSRTPARRASFICKPSDSFIINFDEVTIADLEYYINCRIHRHNYLQMVPVLKAALVAKKQEMEDEAPFRLLLIGEIMKGHQVAHEEAEGKIDELIRWWKYKNFTHRALTSDDVKAVRMIVEEFGKRRGNEITSDDKINNSVVELLKEENTLAIWHRKDNEYVVFKMENEENVFVREEHWRNVRGGIRCCHEKDWNVVDKRYQSWNLLYAHERWAKWNIGVRATDRLTDIERNVGVEYLLSLLSGKLDDYYWNKRLDGKKWMIPLAVNLHEGDVITMWYVASHANISEKSPSSKDSSKPGLRELKASWTKSGRDGKVVFTQGQQNSYEYNYEKPNWEVTYKDVHRHNNSIIKQLRRFDDNIQEFINECKKYYAFKELGQKISNKAWSYCRQIADVLTVCHFEEERLKFLAEEYDDEEMWLDHKSHMRDPHLWPEWVGEAAKFLIEKEIEVAGLTVLNVVEMAEDFGYNGKLNKADYKKVKDVVFEAIPEEKEEPEVKSREDDEWIEED